MRTVLFSTYELGRQPFGLASAAAWLREAGADPELHDLAVCSFDPEMVTDAGFVGIFVPMHTATRLAEPLIGKVRSISPEARIVCFGLYAAMNGDRLRDMGADAVIAGEFEPVLVEDYRATIDGSRGSRLTTTIDRISFRQPERRGLPRLDRYAMLQPVSGPPRVTGYTEASRGCKHTCRHCPIVPVYRGRFVVVEPEVVLADVRAQVAAGAEHITFGDPDFFNGPAHAMRIVRRLHAEFPELTYDVTIKVEHLVSHRDLVPELRDTGCVLVTTAVESFDDEILELFDKGHDAADVELVLHHMRGLGLPVNPTFVPFTPWTSVDGYLDLLARIARLGLVGNVSPVQYGIRLLIPAGSMLLELGEVQSLVEDFDPGALVHPWRHPDPSMDDLHGEVVDIVATADASSRVEAFDRVWRAARSRAAVGSGHPSDPPRDEAVPAVTVPYLTEPWYC